MARDTGRRTRCDFERFYRGKQTQESVAGTGMGLSIARDIVRAHHGKLRVQNTPEGAHSSRSH